MGFDDRLLAESVSAWEQLEPAAIDDRDANDLARQFDGDFESRLVHRARALSIADALLDALRHVRSAVGMIVLTALLVALLGGAATARALLGVPRDEPVNIFHVLAATLLPQTILLLAWLFVMLMPRSSSSMLSFASLGGVVVRSGQWLAQRVHPGRAYAASVAGMSRTFMRGGGAGLGRWTFSSISHALWLAFNVGCLAMLMFLLSTRKYDFAWETTILSADTYQPLTHAIAALPQAAGFSAPSDEQIQASRWEGVPLQQDEGASQAWSSLLVGSIIVYGFGPRLLLAGWSLGRRRAAKSRYRLDVQRPEFARLRSVLEPDVASIGVVDPSPRELPRAATMHVDSHSSSKRARDGLPAIAAIELPDAARKSGGWPPALHGVRWNDLGMIDSREDRQRVIGELSNAAIEPSAMVIVCSLTTTPDRGVSASIAELAACVSASPIIVLTGGQQLRERHPANETARSDFDVRIDDWRAAAQAASIADDRIIEVDLDHLTHASQSKLAAMLGGKAAIAPARRFEDALQLINTFANETRAIDDAAMASLHTSIARLYGDAPPRWREVLRLPSAPADFTPANIAARFATGAERFTAILPERLKRSPKWLAAGAAAGALGCVVAAALISPVAIGALPVWAGLGTAIAAASRLATDAKPQATRAIFDEGGRLDQSVRSAALFAMLLELQRLDERTITRVLDAAIDTSESGAIANANDARRWLDDLRHRFDLALAKEARSS